MDFLQSITDQVGNTHGQNAQNIVQSSQHDHVMGQNLAQGQGHDPEQVPFNQNPNAQAIAQANSPPVPASMNDQFVDFLMNKRNNPSLSVRQNNVRPNIEIEVSLGLMSETRSDLTVRTTHGIPGSPDFNVNNTPHRFESGVSSIDYYTIKKQLERLYEMPGTYTHTRVYTRGTERVIENVINGQLTTEQKYSAGQTDTQIPASQYDNRMKISMEVESGRYLGEFPPYNSRLRDRKRFTWESDSKFWKADLTVVVTNRRYKSWEVELELRKSVVDSWMSLTDPMEIQNETVKIVNQLSDILNIINPRESADISTIQEEGDIHILNTVRAQLGPLWGRPNPNHPRVEFPGSKPVNMQKKEVPKIYDNVYYVAEKTDGVRYFLMSVTDIHNVNRCVLVNGYSIRENNRTIKDVRAYKVEGGEYLSQLLGLGTILDGEMVHNITSGTSIFVAFDIIKYLDVDQSSRTFMERRNILKNVMNVYTSGRPIGNTGHLPIDMKQFYPRREIMELFRSVRMDGRHPVFKDNYGRHHKTDGIIFQPDLPYRYGTDENLLKWKWMHLASVDLYVNQLAPQDRDIKLFASRNGASRGQEVHDIVTLTIQDKARLIADVEHIADEEDTVGQGSIAEVSFDKKSGLWTYMRLRLDKDSPNAIKTVMSTMMELAGGMSEEEMKFRMLSDSFDDEWDVQEEIMGKRAVQWVYGRTAPPDSTVILMEEPPFHPTGETEFYPVGDPNYDANQVGNPDDIDEAVEFIGNGRYVARPRPITTLRNMEI